MTWRSLLPMARTHEFSPEKVGINVVPLQKNWGHENLLFISFGNIHLIEGLRWLKSG